VVFASTIKAKAKLLWVGWMQTLIAAASRNRDWFPQGGARSKSLEENQDKCDG